MSNYIYTNEGLVNVDALAHYGVPGMKWGHRKAARMERRATRRFSRSGRAAGRESYYNEKAAAIRKKHDSAALALEKTAKKYEKQGGYVKAELARRSASAIRQRGMNASANSSEMAARYKNRSEKLLAKANKYAEKKHVDLGKSKVNSIIKKAKQQGYEAEKGWDEYTTEQKTRERLGDNNYAAYNKIRGRG